LKRNAEESHDDVSDAEVGDEEVCDGVHRPVLGEDEDDESVAKYSHHGYSTVEYRQKGHQASRDLDQAVNT